MCGIYIHIPFCRARCAYCNFFFITNTALTDQYLRSLKKEIALLSPLYGSVEYDSIYFGGGTPSLLSGKEINELMETIHKHFRIKNDCEVTMESNPEDFSEKNIREYKSAGINRLSIGVQSFIGSELKFLTRQHSPEDAERSVEKALDAFDNVNADIIYSLPHQTIHDIDYSLSKASSLGVKHVSAYSLTYEEKTVMYKALMNEELERNPDSVEAEMYMHVAAKLESEGYGHYEVSNFAKENFECRHNKKYWNFDNFIGLGPSAHSYFDGERWSNAGSVGSYNEFLERNELPVLERRRSDAAQKHLEFIMLSLRSSGINIEKYNKLFNADFESKFEIAMEELVMNRLALREGMLFRLTEKGYSLADEIIVRYF